eukprot:151156-Rhodomonas_salina.3
MRNVVAVRRVISTLSEAGSSSSGSTGRCARRSLPLPLLRVVRSYTYFTTAIETWYRRPLRQCRAPRTARVAPYYSSTSRTPGHAGTTYWAVGAEKLNAKRQTPHPEPLNPEP